MKTTTKHMIEVDVNGGTKINVPARVVKDGLAITPWVRKDGSFSDYFQITHVVSGLRIPSNGINYKIRQAMRAMEWLLEMTDWNKSGTETVADFNRNDRVNVLSALLRLELNEWGN